MVTAVTTNCDILPSTTEIPLTALTLAMHGWWWWRWWRGLKKENEKRILLGGKKIQTFPCLIPSLTCVAEVIQHWYKIKPQAILLLALNRREKETGIKIYSRVSANQTWNKWAPAYDMVTLVGLLLRTWEWAILTSSDLKIHCFRFTGAGKTPSLPVHGNDIFAVYFISAVSPG